MQRMAQMASPPSSAGFGDTKHPFLGYGTKQNSFQSPLGNLGRILAVFLYPVPVQEIVKFTTGAEQAEEKCFGKSHHGFQAGRESLPTGDPCQAASTNTLTPRHCQDLPCPLLLGCPFGILLKSWPLEDVFPRIKAQGEHLLVYGKPLNQAGQDAVNCSLGRLPDSPFCRISRCSQRISPTKSGASSRKHSLPRAHRAAPFMQNFWKSTSLRLNSFTAHITQSRTCVSVHCWGSAEGSTVSIHRRFPRKTGHGQCSSCPAPAQPHPWGLAAHWHQGVRSTLPSLDQP